MKKIFTNLSIYRLIATICILQFHVFYLVFARSIPFETLLSKGVQGLTALSGFLYSQKVIKDVKFFYLNNLKKILIPASICILFMALWNLIYMFINQSWDYFALFTSLRPYNNTPLIQIGNFYYLGYIIICYLITPLIQRDDKWKVVGILLGLAFELTLVGIMNSPIIVIPYLVGYFVGKKAFGKYVDNETKYSFARLFIWLGILALSLGLYILNVLVPFSDGTFWIEKLQNTYRNVILTIFGISTFFVVIYIFRFVNKYKEIKLLKYTDKLSLLIYLMNQAFMVGAMNVTLWVEPIWAKFLVVNVITIATSVLLEIANRYLNKWIKYPKPKLTQ